MYLLPSTEYNKVRSLFQPISYHGSIAAILARDVAATIYVDDLACPQSVFSYVGYRCFLAGSAENDEFNSSLQQYFSETFLPQGRAAGYEMFSIYYTAGWEPAIEQMLGAQFPLPVQRQYYAFNELKPNWRETLPEGFTIQLVSRALLDDVSLKNRERLAQEMCSERPSGEDYLARSFGVSVLHEGEIAGWCLSEYNTGDRCEIGIETVEEYQRRGLATAMTCAFVEHAWQLGYRHIGWDCIAWNEPSWRTALKAGFVHLVDYPAFLVWYNPVIGAGVHGNRHMDKGDYVGALAWYEKVTGERDAPGWILWGAGCAAARLGQNDAAFGYLNRALDAGFDSLNLFETSPHLAGLRNADGWQELSARVRTLETAAPRGSP